MSQPISQASKKDFLFPRGNSYTFLYYRKKFSRNYRDYGFWISWKKVTAHLLKPFYQKIIYYIYELDLNTCVKKQSNDSKYVFRLIHSGETHLIDQIEQMEEWLSGSLKKKLQNNCLCMVIMDGEKVIGFNYAVVGKGDIPLLKLRILIGPNQAWSEQITISSDYRKQGLASSLRNHFYKELRAKGISTLYGHRQQSNIASKQSARKYTRNVIVRAEFKRILGIFRLKCLTHLPHMPEAIKQIHLKPNSILNTAEAKQSPSDSVKPVFTVQIEDLI
ncbi:MAG: GNAT family N-acetyltransferase [Desulfobacteraceae bacterium]|nr:GNAT family N-acetyltransferase [Desulfobacteraceae bacterium]